MGGRGPTYRGFLPVDNDTGLCILLSVSAQRHIRNNPTASTHGGFEDQAIAKLGSKLHVVNLFYGGFVYARLNCEGLSHIWKADRGWTGLFLTPQGRLSSFLVS